MVCVEGAGVLDRGGVVMGILHVPPDLFAHVVEFLDHRSAIRSTPCSRSWWKSISVLPYSCHVNTCLGRSSRWHELVTQLKLIRLSNPRRPVTRLTLGHSTKIDSLADLSTAAGGRLTHLDLTRSAGSKHLDFRLLAKYMPSLRGLSVKETFYRHEFFSGWLRGLTKYVREASLESLQLDVHEFSCSTNTDRRTKSPWQSRLTSKISDGVLEALASQCPATDDFFIGDCFMGSQVGGLNLVGSGSLFVVNAGGSAGAEEDHDACQQRAQETHDSRRPRPCESLTALTSMPGLTLRKLWLTAPLDGPRVTSGMAALGAGLAMLEELVVEHLRVTDEGWRLFSAESLRTARTDSGRRTTLRRIDITTSLPAFVPSKGTRVLLQEAVGERVTLRIIQQKGEAARGGQGEAGSAGSGRAPRLVDCDGMPLEAEEAGSREHVRGRRKLRVLRTARKHGVERDAGDL